MIRVLKLPTEEWKIIPDLPFLLENQFEISNHGRVRRIRTGNILLGSRRASKEGWKRVHLVIERKRKDREEPRKVITSKNIMVHTMVWQLFGDCPTTPSLHLYHINKCQDDNYVWNLATTNKRIHKRRVKRWKKEGKYYHQRGRRYFHERH